MTVVIDTCNSGTQELETGGPGIQSSYRHISLRTAGATLDLPQKIKHSQRKCSVYKAKVAFKIETEANHVVFNKPHLS